MMLNNQAGQSDDLDRRFGGGSRLYGPIAYSHIRQASVAVVGLGGVGSWAAEALARSGVAQLCLIDLDHVSPSNVNRQIHALTNTFGQSKIQAMRERIALIHPACQVVCIDEFVTADNVQSLLGQLTLDGIIDACDQVSAKAALIAWSWQNNVPLVTVGAAGGKVYPHQVELADLAQVTHDPLLASLRQRLRQHHGGARKGPMHAPCVFSREPVKAPQQTMCQTGSSDANNNTDGSLNCHGYGSSVTVTATFGFTAAANLLNAWCAKSNS